MNYLGSCPPEFAYMIEEALTQGHHILQVLVCCHEITPVVLELQVPPFQLLFRLLFLQIHAVLEVPIYVRFQLIDLVSFFLVLLEELLILTELVFQVWRLIQVMEVALPIIMHIVDVDILIEDLVKVVVLRVMAFMLIFGLRVLLHLNQIWGVVLLYQFLVTGLHTRLLFDPLFLLLFTLFLLTLMVELPPRLIVLGFP
mmetsp:Transcript_39106/g.37431  ORF Transcript_39106/g.37431 Transcript_39106/m.37431 type:complete len:199 (+) Transcript_39106:526-1122(+)